MDEFMGELGSRLKVSITESTMMCIVHDAMDRAHGKVKSRGVVARLSEMSRFYELAIIQLEGCLKFVHEEAEAFGFDSSHQDLLIDLAEIRNHLLGRLEESEMAISDKDRELMDRTETEWRLRQALELKERELESLRAKTEGFDESKEGELQFSELKNSVDQQVWNIRQNLEEPDEHYCSDFGWESGPSDDKIGNRRVERMGLDISNLKETLDLAFGKMQSAIFSSEAGPAEQQWRWAIEKDVAISVIKGSVQDIQETFESREQEEENASLCDEAQKLRQENEGMKLGEIISGQLYVHLIRGFMDELNARLLDFESEVQIREGVLSSILERTVIENKSATSDRLEECNDSMERYRTESCIREEIHRFIYEQALRNVVSGTNAGNLQIRATAEDDISPFEQSVKAQNTARSMEDELGKALEELASSTGQSLLEFSEVISISQQNIRNYIDKSSTRIENMKLHLDLLFAQISLLRKRMSVYEKAFILRCQNLQKAEAEVDLLADQVDLLLGLLKMVHMKLCQHSTVLEQYFEVSEMLMSIEKELGGGDIQDEESFQLRHTRCCCEEVVSEI